MALRLHRFAINISGIGGSACGSSDKRITSPETSNLPEQRGVSSASTRAVAYMENFSLSLTVSKEAHEGIQSFRHPISSFRMGQSDRVGAALCDIFRSALQRRLGVRTLYSAIHRPLRFWRRRLRQVVDRSCWLRFRISLKREQSPITGSIQLRGMSL